MRQSSIDASVFAELSKVEEDGAPGFVHEIIEIFLKDTPLCIDKIKKALVQLDIQAVYLEVHSLKSSCAYMGALSMSNICLKFESLERSSLQTLNISELIKDLEEEYHRVKTDLEAITFDTPT